MPKVKTRITNNSSWLQQREIGQRNPLGHADRFSKRLYSSLNPCTSWDHGENLRHAMHGGVFNLEFSPDGLVLCIHISNTLANYQQCIIILNFNNRDLNISNY